MSTSPEDLAALIKSKYADYADVPDRELVARIVSKYPDYQSQLPAFNVDGAQKLRGASPQLVQHYLNLYDQFQQAGIKPIVRSGMRTAEQEYYLYTHGYPTKGNTGYGSNISPHQEGRAIDFSFAPEQREKGRAILAQYAQANGLHVPSDEPWHIAIPKNTREMMAYEPDIEQSSEMYDVGGQQQGTPTAQQPTPQGQQAQTVSTQTISPYDLEWHLGVPAGQAGEWFNGLPKAKQSQVFREVSKAMAKDEQKKAAGIQLTPSTDYQSGMRKRLKVAAPVPQEPGVVTAPTSVLPQIGGDLSMSNVVADARKRRDMRTPEQANDSRLMEQAVKNVSGFTVSPTANLKTLYRAVAKGLEGGFQADVEDEFNKLKGQQGRSETPEMITERAAYGNMPAAVRGVVAPVRQFYGGLLKDLGGVASVLGIAPNRLSDYLNTRGQFMEEAATNAPLKISGQYVQMPSKGASMFDAPYNQKQIAEIKRGLPEKVESTIANLGLGITKLVLMKEVTGLSMGQIMPIETAFQTSNDPLEDRIAAIAQARVLGQVLDSHLSRLVSAAIFGGPTAVEQGEQYAKGNIPLSEAILQTGLQSGIGFALGGKGLRFGREPLPEPITLTKVPDTFPEEVASGSPKTADWIRQQNEAFTSRLRAAENRGDTAEADRLRAQQSGLQERFGKIMARTVPPEPGTSEASPELQARVQAALENELHRSNEVERQIQSAIQPSNAKALVDTFQKPDDFQFARTGELQDVIDFKPKKGTTKARRAEIDSIQSQAKAELARRASAGDETQQAIAARIEATRYSTTPRFDDWAENETGQRVESIPQDELLRLGERYRTEFKDAPPPPALREFPPLPIGEQTNAAQKGIVTESRGQQYQGTGSVGPTGEASDRNRTVGSGQVQKEEVQQVAPRIVPMVDGKFRVAIEGATGTSYRTFNTQAEAEAAIAKLPRVPTEPTPQAVPPAAAAPSSATVRVTESPIVQAAIARAAERARLESQGVEYRGSGGPDTQRLIDDIIIKGAEFYDENRPTFDQWSKEMRKRFGKDAKPHLRGVYMQFLDHERRQYAALGGSPPSRVPSEPSLQVSQPETSVIPPSQGAATEAATASIPLVDQVSALVDERGNLTRGGDYVTSLMKGRSDAEVKDLLQWTRSQNEHVQRFVGANVIAELRSRGIDAKDVPMSAQPLTPVTKETRPILDALARPGAEDAYVVAGGQRLKVQSSQYGMFGRATAGSIHLADGSEIDANMVTRVENANGDTLWEKPTTPTAEPTKVIKHKDPALDGAKVIGKKDGSKFLIVEKPDGSTTTIQNPHGPLGNEKATVGGVPVEPLKPIPLLSVGNEGTASTERGREIAFRYAIVEARDPVTSHDEFQQPNPQFPEEAQPRDRSRVASAAQINEIAKNAEPAKLADSPYVAHGAPILDESGVAEVGNGRISALRQMYRTGGDVAERYRQFVIDNAARLGLDPEKAKAADEPLLTRIRTTPLTPEERVQFVDEGNEQGTARMSAPEQASADSRKISGQLLSVFRPSESGEINTAANHGFIQAFVRDVINPAEVGEYVDARGAISQAGISRIRNAIFARAYGDSPEGLRALEKIAESPDNNVRNITNALLQRAGGFANLKEGIADGTRYDSLDITSDLTKALSKMSALREQDQTVADYLQQNELFEPELTTLQRQMLHVLDEYKRSGKAVSEVLGNYLELTEAAGNPNQEGLFGTRDTAPDPSDLFEAAARKAAEDANAGKGKPANQTGLFASQGVPPEPSTGSGRLSTPSSAGEPDNQSGGGLFEANQSTESAGGAESSPLGFGRGRTKPPPPLPTTEPELRDVQRQMTPGSGNTHGEVVDGLLSLTLPSAKSPAHLRVAEMLGRRIGEMNRRAESASSLLGRWITKFYKLGVDRDDVEPKDNAGVQFASAMATGGKVDPSLEPAAKLIKVLFDGRLRLLEEAGVPLQQVRDNYFPGMWTRESRVAFNAGLQDAIEQGVIKEGEDLNASSPEQRQWVRDRVNQYMEQGNGSDRDMLSYLTRRPLAGKESFKKEKVFDDILTAQEFGLRPNSNNPAEIVKVKLSEIDRSIMAHQHFQDLSKAPAAPQFADSFRALLRDRGVTGDRLNEPVAQIQRISPYEQVPQGWIKVNDKYGTIYGPPTIEVSEHIDKAVYQGLLDVANKLGISHERVAALRGGNLGLSYQGENRIQTKFATETSVMAHEIGHQLDAKYDLWNNLLRTQPKSGEPGKGFRAGRGELRDIADMAERGKVSRSKEEKIAQVLEAYIHAPERMQEVAPRVYKWFDNFVKTTPELAPLADIKPGIALQKLTTQKYVGLPILGYRIVPEPVGDILNNYLSSSLYNSQYFGKPFKAWMATASVLNQSQLGVGSAFHASFTSGDVQTAAGANMIKDIYGVVRGNRDAGDVASSFGKWTTAIVRTPIVGDRVLNAWRNPDGVMDPKIAQVVRAAELAQGGFKLERGLKTEQTDKMVSDWYSGHRIKAALRSPIAGTELMAKPIMEWIVPREKGGAFADMAWRIIEQNPGKSMEELTPDFRKAWNRIDGRLGQVRYDRIFANNVAKNVTQGLIRAPGWSGGTLAELGGAFKDLGSFAKEWAQTGKAPQELPDRVAYGMSLLISTAVVNGALTYAFTGQRPHGMDFFAFRDGNKDKDGNETRLLIPSYMKDILAYYEEGPSTLLSKTHPLISLVNDVVIKNKDYFGTEIRDPNDPYYKQGEEVAKYVLKAFIPFWIRGVQRQQEQGGGYGRMAASYMGVMPAPSYLIQSDATKDLNQMIKDKLPAVRTPPTDRQEAMKEIIQGRRKGEDTSADLLAARQEGLINKRDVQRIGEQGRIDPMEAKLQSVYRDYGLSGVLDWYERHESYLDPEMKTDAQKVIRRARLSLAQHPENMRGDAQQRQEMMRRINSALGLKTVPQPPPTTAQTPNAPM